MELAFNVMKSNLRERAREEVDSIEQLLEALETGTALNAVEWFRKDGYL